MCVHFIAKLLLDREGWDRKPVNHTRLMTVVTPTVRPMSLCNRCVYTFSLTFLFSCVVLLDVLLLYGLLS